MKRLFDLFAALFGLIILSPVLMIIAVAVKLESRGPVFFRGERAGKDGKPFGIYKFRTMVEDAAQRGGRVTFKDDPRVTRIGSWLRRNKFDELPQLINVVKGEMSLVGPRPEDPRYVRYYTPRQREVFSFRPGITSLASIRFRHEEELLPSDNCEKVYIERILPAKLGIELNYIDARSFGKDLLILFSTIFSLAKDEIDFGNWAKATEQFEQFLGRYLSWMTIDIILIIAAYALALAVRSVTAPLDIPLASVGAMAGVTVYILTNYLFGIYNRVWRYASAQEAAVVFSSVTAATIVLSLLDLLLQERALPLGAIWLGGFFSFSFLIAVRYRRRLARGAYQALQGYMGFTSGQGARVLIVGAKDAAQLLGWQLQNNLQAYQVVGFVDDDRERRGMRIHNVPVYGDRHQIPDLVARLHIDLIVIGIPLAKAKEPKELLDLCRSTAAQIKVVPGLLDLLETNGTARLLKDVKEDEALLQREAYQVDQEACRVLLTDRVVMVTGAAGSIGSELCRQIAGHRPRQLVLLDIDESDLHDLQVELQANAKDVNTEIALCDISNFNRLKSTFEKTRPQIVFHAAAYKHVPILEDFPHEAMRVNVLGTRYVHSLAYAYGAERFVLISSDKAANPCSVLGMTKWIGEVMVMACPREGPMISTTVRFGNVLGSRGSVVPTFAKQIELGGPITITHSAMTRYFLSIGEAVSLVIQAATTACGDDLFILDMGVPVPVVDLAERMIRARGLRPGQDILIEFVGIRRGEKICEELLAADEEQVPTDHPSIFRIRRTAPLNLEGFDSQIDRLLSMSENGANAGEIRAELQQCVQRMQSTRLEPAEKYLADGVVSTLETVREA